MTFFRHAVFIVAMCGVPAVTSAQAVPATLTVEQANQFVQDIQAAVRAGGDINIREAEDKASRIDAMPADSVQPKLQAHLALGSYYRNLDIEHAVVRHYSRILELSDKRPGEEALNYAVAATANLAGVWINRGDQKRALSLIDKTLGRLLAAAPSPQLEEARRFLEDQRARYRMIGEKAPPLEARYWLNVADSSSPLEMSGKVRLLVFTATFCAPCQKSYLALKRLADEFAPRGFEVVFATRLFGTVGPRRVAPDEELQQNRRHFVEEHNLGFPVAIEAQPPASQRTRPGWPSESPNERNYHTAGIPEYILIDRVGTIRRIVFAGWDPANEAGIRDAILSLLPATSGGR